MSQETSTLIYRKIMEVMASIGAVGKNSDCNAPGAKFKYRGIDAVMNALQPALIKAEVCVVPEVLSLDRNERINKNGTCLTFSTVKVRYRFYTSDGSFIETVVAGEGMDSGDKSVNKAMSAAFKYAAFQVFCIPTEEMRDPDAQAYADVMSSYQGHQLMIQPQYASQPVLQQEYYPGVPQPGSFSQPQPVPQAPRPLPSPQMTLDDASSFVCSFGRNKGLTMGQIAQQPRSGEELSWFITARPDSIEAAAAQMILQSRVM